MVVFITPKEKKKKRKKKKQEEKKQRKGAWTGRVVGVLRGVGGWGSGGGGGECVAAYFMLPLVRKPLSVLLSTVYNCDRHVLA